MRRAPFSLPSRQLGFFTPMAFANTRYVVGGADFDGSNDHMARGADLTGAINSKLFSFGTWFRLDGGDGSDLIILSSTIISLSFLVVRTSTGELLCQGRNSAGTLILEINSGANTYTAGSTWRWLGISCDMSDPGKLHMFVNNTDVLSVVTYTNDTLDFTAIDWGVGAAHDGTSKFNGALADTYFRIGEYSALSTESVRRKWITSSGKPVYLGPTGNIPTGTAADILCTIGKHDAASRFATNRGTGGNFSITGSLEIASTSPSD